MPENDEIIIRKINESMDFLDSSLEVKKPDLMEFIKLVNETQEKKELDRNRQFITFLLSAIMIVVLETFAFSKSFTVFIVIQAVAVLFILPAIIIWLQKKRRQVSE